MKSFAALLLVPTLALAAGSAQTHHCVKDGQTIEKTKKDCKKEGGKWEKNSKADAAASTTAAPAPKADATAPAATPTPAPAAK